MLQITNTILMVRPRNVRANEQTAANNHYQKQIDADNIQERILTEFDNYVKKLREVGVNVLLFHQDDELDTPDAHFPNNWMSTHKDGILVLYPMYAENRRLERREAVIDLIEEKGFLIDQVIDYTGAEDDDVFLESTGAFVLDREHRNAYCALSDRADEELFIEFCEDLEYTPVIFTAYQTVDNERKPIYHTNVMMCIAETFTMICLDCIDDKKERKQVIKFLKSSGKQIIEINEDQVSNFAGNMLQVIGDNDERFLVMSETAYKSLTNNQKQAITKHCDIIYSDIGSIEACAGGSVRCLMAEVFLQK